MYRATRIGLVREGKTPPDNRVALTPRQCRELMKSIPGLSIVAQRSAIRCFSDDEYRQEGIPVVDDLSDCDILLGIKEVRIEDLIRGKTYLFFSHTKKAQPYNRPLMQAMIKKGIRLVDYECLTHTDGQRILGFGFFAGIVGAHNGLLAYGRRTGKFSLPPAHQIGSLDGIRSVYDDLVLPPVRIVVTGGGKVAAGILEIMNSLDVEFIEPEDFLANDYDYPVYTHLKGPSLYVRKDNGRYSREDFHTHPGQYRCLFGPYLSRADILMNGIYWDRNMPRLFEKEEAAAPGFRLHTIADITCDPDGSVPLNLGASTIADPVYGVHRFSLERTLPFQNNEATIDIMAVDNLPNELPRDASAHFGTHLEKYVLRELLQPESELIARATLCSGGRLTAPYDYLSEYAYGEAV